MVREVDDRVLVARRFVADRQLVVIREAIDDRDVHRTRIPARAIWAHERELDAGLRFLCIPELVVETRRAAVDMILLAAAVITVELVCLAADRHFAVRDAVRMAADDAAHARAVLLIIRRRIVAEHDIDERAGRCHLTPLREPRAIRRDRSLRALRVPQRIEERLPAVTQLAKRFFPDLRHAKSLPTQVRTHTRARLP